MSKHIVDEPTPILESPQMVKEKSLSASVLVGFATRYGSTQEVAEAVTTVLRTSGLSVDIQLLRDVRTLTGYRAIVLGAPLFMFRGTRMHAISCLGTVKPS